MSVVLLLRTPSSDDLDKYELTFISAGYTPISVPVLETVLMNVSHLTNVISQGPDNQDEGYTGIIMTSARACEAWKAAVENIVSSLPQHTSSSWKTLWSSLPFYAVGQGTASSLSALYDLFPAYLHLIPSPTMVCGQESGNAEQLARFIVQDVTDKRGVPKLLYLTGDKNRETLPSILNEAGVTFEPVQVYGTKGSSRFKEVLEMAIGAHPKVIDWWIVYFAPSAAQFATPILEDYFILPCTGSSRLSGSGRPRFSARIAAIGPTTLSFLQNSLHLLVTATAQKPSPEILLLMPVYVAPSNRVMGLNMPGTTTITNTFLPLLLFPILSALATTYIFGHVATSNLDSTIQASCPGHFDPYKYPYRLRYVGIDLVDRTLCNLVTFFQFAIQQDEDEPLPRLFTSYCLGNLLPIFAILAIETQRYRVCVKAAGDWVGNPILSSFSFLGALFQNVTIAITIPIYWMTTILSRSRSTSSARRGEMDSLTRQHVEAVMFGLLMGCLVPTIGMVILNDPYVTAIWQFFPFIVSTLKHLHLAVRRPAKEGTGDVRGTVRLVYLTMGIVASSIHAATVWPKLVMWDLDSLKLLFVPARMYGHTWVTTAGQAMELLQWDGIFTWTATMLGSLWFTVGGGWIGMAIWYVIAIPLAGPGAAVAGVAFWQEAH
ncbi:hypothetical protein AX15_001227 [Amanita polypyramis BW_CC]|nr:hypothetical protein AX15_001227 [Amanita polypyramis BW_CC]